MILIGIDPGAEAGLVAVAFPTDWRMDLARWVGSAKVNRGDGSMSAARDRQFRDKLAATMAPWSPDLAVIECPVDARAYWQVKTRFGGKTRESPETRFWQGKHYAAAVHAVPDTVPVVAYPVKGRKGTPGWMGKRTRNDLLYSLPLLARALGCTGELSEHELMALGVLAYHAGQQLVGRAA